MRWLVRVIGVFAVVAVVGSLACRPVVAQTDSAPESPKNTEEEPAGRRVRGIDDVREIAGKATRFDFEHYEYREDGVVTWNVTVDDPAVGEFFSALFPIAKPRYPFSHATDGQVHGGSDGLEVRIGREKHVDRRRLVRITRDGVDHWYQIVDRKTPIKFSRLAIESIARAKKADEAE